MTKNQAIAVDQLLAVWNHRQDLREAGAPFEARLVADRQLASARRHVADARLAA